MTEGSKSPATAPRDHLKQMHQADHIRFTALGDSATYGLGDPVDRGWRGWARLLADAMAAAHQVSFCNLAAPGATIREVRDVQLPRALEHGAVFVSLVVGLNDVMRSTWDPVSFRDDLLHCAQQLTDSGAVIMTARFHDHGRVFGLPRWLSRLMAVRIDELNRIYDEVHERYGMLRIDLGDDPATYDRDFWFVDRLHPSEYGHRRLAARVATLLNEEGLDFEPPSTTCIALRPSRLKDAHVVVSQAAPWVARRLWDLTSSAVRMAASNARLGLV